MKYLMLGFNIFCNNLILNLILIIQLTVAVVLINFTVGHLNSSQLVLHCFEPIANEKGIYYMPSIMELLFKHDKTTDENRDRFTIIEDLDEVSMISTVYSYTVIKDNTYLTAFGYDSFMADRIKLFLNSGVWFAGYKTEDEVVPVVVTSESKGFKVGNEITVNLYHHFYSDKPEIKLKVVGALRPPYYLWRYNTGGNVITVHDLFERFDEQYYDGPAILFENSKLEQYGLINYGRDDINRLVFFKDTTSEISYRESIGLLADSGFVQTLDQMYLSGLKESGERTRAMLPYIAGALAVSLIGIISLNILNTLLHIKVFAIYYLSGSRWINCIFISLGYILWIILISMGLLLAIYYLALSFKSHYIIDLHISANNLVFTGGVYLAVIVLSMIVPFRILSKTYPIEIIRSY